MQRVIALGRQHPIHGDQILHATDLRAKDDVILAQSKFFRRARRFGGTHHHGPHHHRLGVLRIGLQLVLIHHPRQQRLIQRAPVHTDAHRAIVFDGRFNHRPEVIVVLLADVHVARVDAILRQRPSHIRVLLQQQVAVVVEVAHDRHLDAEHPHRLDDFRHRDRRFIVIHRDAHQLAAGFGQSHHLIHGGLHVRRIGVRHGLHHNRVPSTNPHAAHIHSNRTMTRIHAHNSLLYRAIIPRHPYEPGKHRNRAVLL